jgi:hypothetical protein
MPFRNDEYPVTLCRHPEDRLSFVRDEPGCRWVGRCEKCGSGPNEGASHPPIIRTDEQIANGEAPMVSMVDQFIAWRDVKVLVP